MSIDFQVLGLQRAVKHVVLFNSLIVLEDVILA